MKLTCVSIYDARDPRAYGGKCYYKLRAIEPLVNKMQFIGPLRFGPLYPLLGAKLEYYRRIAQKVYFPRRDSMLIRYYSKQISTKMRAIETDVVLSPVSRGSQPIAYVECKQPIVIWTDATFAGALDLHYKNLTICSESIRDGLDNERAALSRAKLLIYYTKWAAKSAIRAYNLDPAKVAVIPPGAWLEGSPDLEEAAELVGARPSDRCRLLFIGSNWVNKGGDIALEVARRLNADGLRTELIVVGCTPEPLPEPLPDFVRVVGYIDRASRPGSEQFEALLRTSHFLLLPSRFEAMGLVFCEASAFAVPCLASDVGGIPDVVRNGINGRTFALDSGVEEYCECISEMMADTTKYRELSLSALNEYKTRLNTNTAAREVINLIGQL
jgi:glycosyltransferase involved in cell wall biosynthesis